MFSPQELVDYYHNLQISSLSPFLHHGLLKYNSGHIYNPSPETSTFVRTLTSDEFRVTVDFTKNKFRAMCILSSPTSLDFDSSSFKFSYIPNELSISSIATILVNSGIYAEYTSVVSVKLRYLNAVRIIQQVTGAGSDLSTMVVLTQSQKLLIIRRYLTGLAMDIQVHRIYSQYVKEDSENDLETEPEMTEVDDIDDMDEDLDVHLDFVEPKKPSLAKKSFANLLSLSPSKLLFMKPKPLDPPRALTFVPIRPASPDKLKLFPKVPPPFDEDAWRCCKHAVQTKIRDERHALKAKVVT